MQTRNWTTFAGTLEEFVANRKSAMRRRVGFAHAPLPDFPKIIVTKSAVDGVHLKGPRLPYQVRKKWWLSNFHRVLCIAALRTVREIKEGGGENVDYDR